MNRPDPAGPAEALLARFPKTRPPLSPKEAAVHTEIMMANRERLTLFTRISDRLESWMHHRVARRDGVPPAHAILEIGAGTLNHVPYEPAEAAYDVVEPERAMYRGRAEAERVRAFYDDIGEITTEARYRRIVSIATLEHMTNLPAAVAHAGLLLAPGGVFQVGIPSEGGLLWGLSWRMTVAVDLWLRTRHNWVEHMRHEHINTAPEIITVIRHFFGDVSVRRFPVPTHHLSLYAAIEARGPNVDLCRAYRDRRTDERPADK